MAGPTSTLGADRAALLVGPLLRYADASRATVWVEADRACSVAVVIGDHVSTADTWSVHGHHFALLRLDDLGPCTAHAYEVTLDGHTVWPLPDSGFPPSVIRTIDPGDPFRLAFGSCRRSDPLDERAPRRVRRRRPHRPRRARWRTAPHDEWPDTLLLIGDQIYADEPSDDIVARLRAARTDPESRGGRRDPELRGVHLAVPRGVVGPGGALDPVHRPDRDAARRPRPARRLEHVAVVAPPGHRRSRGGTTGSIGGYASYWVYQHLGNLSPEQLDADEVYARMLEITDDDERSRYLDDVAWRADIDAHRSGGATTATSATPAAACASWPSTAVARGSSTPTTGGWSMPPSGRGSASTSSATPVRSTTSCSRRRCRS